MQRCLIRRVANCCPPFVWWSLCKYSCQGQRLCHIWYSLLCQKTLFCLG